MKQTFFHITLSLVFALLGAIMPGATCAAEQKTQLIYSVQISTNTVEAKAALAYEQLQLSQPEYGGEARMERVGKHYVIRVGTFATPKQATPMLRDIRRAYPDALLVAARLLEDRILLPRPAAKSNNQETIVPEVITLPQPAEITPVAVPVDMETGTEALSKAPAHQSTSTAVTPNTKSEISETNSEQPVATADTPIDTSNNVPKAKAPATVLGMPAELVTDTLLGAVAFLALIVLLLQMRPHKTKTLSKQDCYQIESATGPWKLHPKLEKRLQENINHAAQAEENLMAVDKNARTIYFSSSMRGEGKTIASLSMAHAISTQMDAPVLLIDGSTPEPILHKLFGMKRSLGFMDVISGQTNVDDAIKPTIYENLSIMPFGSNDSTKNIHPDKVSSVLEALCCTHKYIIYDGPTLWSTPNAALIAARFDGVILAAEAQRVKWEVVQMNKQKIESVGGTVFGMVLNKRYYYIPRFLYGKV
ncbi:MAG: CpsD/CapB family tyrosine-protein kinase [Desulfovibrio sp.]